MLPFSLGDSESPRKVEISDEIAAALEAEAEAHGVDAKSAGKSFETGYGMWARYGPAPSAEEIDENRREMFRDLA